MRYPVITPLLYKNDSLALCTKLHLLLEHENVPTEISNKQTKALVSKWTNRRTALHRVIIEMEQAVLITLIFNQV